MEWAESEGLLLLDIFALEAMKMMIHKEKGQLEWEWIATYSYGLAEEMIKKRSSTLEKLDNEYTD